MSSNLLLVLILMPLLAGGLVLLLRRFALAQATLLVLTTLVNLLVAARWFGADKSWSAPWGPFSFDLRLYHFSGFCLLAVAGFSFLVAIYSVKFMKGRPFRGLFYAFLLLSLAMVNGALLADHLLVLLFCWESLLLTLFGIIAIGRPGAYRTATKAFIIVGVSDLCMMVGIALTGYLAGTLTLSKIHHLELTGLGGLAMLLMVIGAISKAGSMPFHTWIPDAAIDAPLPFMAFLPASLEKLLGIYLLARISLDLFRMEALSWMSYTLMTIGALTILGAVMMALVQKDYKRLLSYHAISQVGYMVLGIGTATPVGIVGGLFHMINHAMYKSCLFLTGGAVEKQTGTTDLAKLGGLAAKMPVTCGCFLVAAASISGVPPFNGFFSKELVYDGALERGTIFYIAALLGSFFTAASFLKLGHAAYFGKRDPAFDRVKEAPLPMLLPMIVIAGFCILFGVWNALPLKSLILPSLNGTAYAAVPEHAAEIARAHFIGWPASVGLVLLTLISLAGAVLNHIYGVKTGGSGVKAAEHIHHTPVLAEIYAKAEQRKFDPYDIGLQIVGWISRVGWQVDRAVDWCYDVATVRAGDAVAAGISRAHTGNYSMYVVWSLAGVALVVAWLTGCF